MPSRLAGVREGGHARTEKQGAAASWTLGQVAGSGGGCGASAASLFACRGLWRGGGDFLPMPANAATRCQWVLYRLTSAGLPRIIRLFARLLLRRAMAKKGPDEDGAEGTPAPTPESGNDRQTCIYSLGARYWHYAELPPIVRLSARCAARRHTILSCLAKPGLASEWMRAWRY